MKIKKAVSIVELTKTPSKPTDDGKTLENFKNEKSKMTNFAFFSLTVEQLGQI